LVQSPAHAATDGVDQLDQRTGDGIILPGCLLTIGQKSAASVIEATAARGRRSFEATPASELFGFCGLRAIARSVLRRRLRLLSPLLSYGVLDPTGTAESSGLFTDASHGHQQDAYPDNSAHGASPPQ
jgi:hypothetical protein